MEKIEQFDGEYRFLSNFYLCPIEYDGITYPSSEHAYQAAKTFDVKIRKKIAAIKTPNQCKKTGKTIPIRPDWNDVKLFVMKEIVGIKFRTNLDLKEKLLATNDAELIEGNWWGDKYWGVCKGEGFNYLGKILTKLREELKQEGQQNESGT